MINSDSGEVDGQQDAALNASLRSSGMGAAALAGLATTIVVAIWFAFYLLVFVPRTTGP